MILMASVLILASSCEEMEYEQSGGIYGIADVSPMVEQWRSLVEQYAQANGIADQTELLLAMIAQESGGDAQKTPDIMQCSAYAGYSITDAEDSIRQGVKYFASLLQTGKDKGVEADAVLQAYNYGGGYISYININYNGKHSESAARAFSQKMAAQLGWSNYGDVLYVEHVKSHLSIGNVSDYFEEMYAVMKEYEGVPYLYGGNSKIGIDCSSMTQVIYRAAGITLPRTAQAQYDAVKHIDASQAQPGDLVFFTGTYNSGTYITHVGVYVGNGQFFHAGGSHCQFSSFTDYYKKHFVCYGRK